MQVLIMAAGSARRLMPLTEKVPKTLLNLGDKKIIHHIMDVCQSQGLKDFHLLTGHGHEHVKEAAEEYAAKHPEVDVNLIYNDEYSTKGNIYSMYVGQDIFDKDFILINSDTIFHPEILKALVEHPEDNVMVLDDYKSLSDEEMKVILHKDGHIDTIHKSLDPEKSNGEYIGVMKMAGQHKENLLKSLQAVIDQDPSLYYEDALQHLMNQGVKFHTCSTCGHPCMEIDTHEDLAEAREMIKKINE